MAGILNVDEIADSTGTRPVNFPNGISIDNNRISGIPGYNYIINGNFDIWQRGTSQTVFGYGSDDRWVNGHYGSAKTHTRQTFAVGSFFPDGTPCPTYYSRTNVVSVTGALNEVRKTQRIEGVKTLAGKRGVLSFYAKANTNKNMAIEFIQTFGTGGSPSGGGVGIGTQKISLTSSWQRFVIVVDIPSIIGKTLGTNGDDSLQLSMWFDAGSDLNARTDSLGHQSGTFDIACVSLVEGDVDVKPIPRSYSEELALCQRYFQTSYSNGVAIGTASLQGRAIAGMCTLNDTTAPFQFMASFPFPTQLRTYPSVGIYSPASGLFGVVNRGGNGTLVADDKTPTTINFGASTMYMFNANINLPSAYTGGQPPCFHWVADAEL